MDIYIERKSNQITLDEWREFVNRNNELVLEEKAVVINPLTKQVIRMEVPGRTLYNGAEINYMNGRIGIEGADSSLIRKLRQIAEELGAGIFDCGQEI